MAISRRRKSRGKHSYKRSKHHSTHRRKVKRYSRRGTKRRRRKRTKRLKRGGGNKTRKIMVGGGMTYFLGLPKVKDSNSPLLPPIDVTKEISEARSLKFDTLTPVDSPSYNGNSSLNVKKSLTKIYGVKVGVSSGDGKKIGDGDTKREYIVKINGSNYPVLRWKSEGLARNALSMNQSNIKDYFKKLINL